MSIEVLPNELLLKIFNDGGQAEKIACRVVCKRWRDIITAEYSETIYLSHCKLAPEEEPISLFQDASYTDTPKLKYKKLVIGNGVLLSSQFIEAKRWEFLESITEIYCQTYDRWTINALKYIIPYMKKVEVLHGFTSMVVELLDVGNLKQTLEVIHVYDTIIANVWKILREYNSLKNLKIHTFLGPMEDYSLTSFPKLFGWKAEISAFGSVDINKNDKQMFWCSVGENGTKGCVERWNFSSPMNRLAVIENICTLKTISIEGNWIIPASLRLPSVEALIIEKPKGAKKSRRKWYDERKIRQILKCFPQLTFLDISNVENANVVLNVAQKELLQLRTLAINAGFIPEKLTVCKRVKHLKLNTVAPLTTDCLHQVCIAMPNLIGLTITSGVQIDIRRFLHSVNTHMPWTQHVEITSVNSQILDGNSLLDPRKLICTKRIRTLLLPGNVFISKTVPNDD